MNKERKELVSVMVLSLAKETNRIYAEGNQAASHLANRREFPT